MAVICKNVANIVVHAAGNGIVNILESVAGNQCRYAADEDEVVVQKRPVLEAQAQVSADVLIDSD